MTVYQYTSLRAPHDGGVTANDFQVRKFDCDTLHKVNAVPATWAGKVVRLYVTGGNLHFAFSKSGSAEVDSSVASTDAGASLKVGDFLKDGGEIYVRLPGLKDESESLFFVREASVDNSICYMRLASD